MRLTEEIIDLLNWERIWEELCDFRIVKGYWNLVLHREGLRNLLLSDRYKIMALPEILEVKTQGDVIGVENIAILVIKKYIDLFYKKYAKRFETENLRYATVGKQLTLFAFEKPGNKYSYTVQIDKREKNLIKEIKKLARDFNRLLEEDTKTLPRIYFDNHLYVPILLQSEKINRISPSGLVESEKEFVSGLRQYLRKNKDKFSGVDIYLLRNYPRSGVGFFNLSGFYPDFIMWIKKGKEQFMIFIDPKGLEHTKGLDDEKIKLNEDIKQLTTYEKLIEGRTSPPPKYDYVKNNVIFLNDKDWPDVLFSKLTVY